MLSGCGGILKSSSVTLTTLEVCPTVWAAPFNQGREPTVHGPSVEPRQVRAVTGVSGVAPSLTTPPSGGRGTLAAGRSRIRCACSTTACQASCQTLRYVSNERFEMTQTRAEGTFTVASLEVAEVVPAIVIHTAMESGVATMEKHYTGEVEGRSATLFSSCRDTDSGAASYVALESFEGSLHGVPGSFNFVHSASTHGEDRYGDFFAIVAASGTARLASISGSGGLTVDADGTHRVWFDYLLE